MLINPPAIEETMQVVTHCWADRRGGGSRGEWERTDDVTKSSRRRQKGRGGWKDQQRGESGWNQFTLPPMLLSALWEPVPFHFYVGLQWVGDQSMKDKKKRSSESHSEKRVSWGGNERLPGEREGHLEGPPPLPRSSRQIIPPSNTHQILQYPSSLLPSPLHSYWISNSRSVLLPHTLAETLNLVWTLRLYHEVMKLADRLHKRALHTHATSQNIQGEHDQIIEMRVHSNMIPPPSAVRSRKCTGRLDNDAAAAAQAEHLLLITAWRHRQTHPGGRKHFSTSALPGVHCSTHS